MTKYFSILLLVATFLYNQAFAQILEDEPTPEQKEVSSVPESDYEETEALFDKMFEEFSESEKDISRPDKFDDAITRATAVAKEQGDINTGVTSSYVPLNGDMFIGIKDGSFKIYQDIMGRMNCTFTVVLNSNLDRDIKRMGLNLIYPMQSFAFIFRDVPAKGSQTRYITTTGDICYNISGVPDIRINMCRIRQASGKECMNRLKWKDNIVPQ
jgi:hypothetical protein